MSCPVQRPKPCQVWDHGAEFEHPEVCKESWKEQGPYAPINSKEKGIDQQTWGSDPPQNQTGS
jgi:hypothetical protein